MDDKRFDHLVRALTGGATRRGVLGVLSGVVGLGLVGVAAKGGKGRGKKRGSAKSRGGRRGDKKAGKSKATICHYDRGSRTYKPISVGQSAVSAHISNHGDFYRTNCCMDAECRGGEICDHGTCLCPQERKCESGCCAPPPQMQDVSSFCCDNDTCSCGGDCCGKDECFWTGPQDKPTDEFCCTEPNNVICGEGDGATCCPKAAVGDSCEACESNPSGIAGSYRRPR